MTKLPTVYLPTVNGSGVTLLSYGTAYTSRGNFAMYDATEDPQVKGAVAYEPAVPRCKTCPHFSWHTNDNRRSCSRSILFVAYVPDDGSGYCYEHPEANQ